VPAAARDPLRSRVLPDDELTDEPEREARRGEEGRDERRKPSVALLVAPIVILGIAATIATALTPALAAKHPLLLIILEARNRNLLLARHVDIVPFVVVATLRRTLTDPLYFLLGHFYGDAVIRWLEKKGGGGAAVRWIEGIFAKASYPMVFLFPGALVCALAGSTGMRPVVFIVLNVAGTVAAVLVLRKFGDVFGGPVDSVLEFFNRNIVWTTAITIGCVLIWLVFQRTQGGLELDAVSELEEEIERGET
jgi:membrane protein DedA with SNARE-associated domain